MRPSVIGLDLDNTIIDYEPAFQILSKTKGGLGAATSLSAFKQKMKQDFPSHWQAFQAELYTVGLNFAQPSEWVTEFLQLARSSNVRVCIVSHKSRFSLGDPTTPLREPAVRWLEMHGILDDLVPRQAVFFAETPSEKQSLIRAIGADWFVDDLSEVLCDPGFPSGCRKFLYTSEGLSPKANGSEAQCLEHVNFRQLATLLGNELGELS